MKKIVLVLSIFLSLILSSLLVIGCQDEDFGYTKEEIFRGAYERNFIKAFGAIDPNETWDFSKWGNRGGVGAAKTRAGEADPGWYRVDQRLIDDFFQTTLKEGEDHSKTGENFCLLTGHEDFTLTPIFKSSTSNNWSLHMVLFKLDGTKVDKVVWSNSTNDVIKIQTDGCQYCGGRGFLSDNTSGHAVDQMECPTCDGGWISNPNCTTCNNYRTVNGEDCPDCKPCERCGGNGTTHDGTCPTCTGNKTLPCTNCNGTGYTSEKAKNGNGKGQNKKNFYSCSICGSGDPLLSSSKQNEFNKRLAAGEYTGKIGDGKMNCTACGGDGKTDKICDVCLGDKYFTKCNVCNGTNAVYQCTACNGTGLSDGSWQSITAQGNTNHTTDAKAIEGHPVSAEACLRCSIPTDGVVYFYLSVDGEDLTSMENGMRLFTPQILNTGDEVVKLIACESGDGTNDYNDFVFLLSGSPTALRTEKEADFTSVVSKRYMAEDFGSNADWDFNDVVTDVTRSLTQRLTGSGKSITKTVSKNTQFATLKHLHGTVPIQVKVANLTFNRIVDPTNEDYTLELLDGETPTNPGKGEVHGWDPNYTQPITGWDPDTNDITVYVWKDSNGGGIEGNTNAVDVWQSVFPNPGDVPYIIATDVTAAPNWTTTDGELIWTLDWFSQKYPNVRK